MDITVLIANHNYSRYIADCIQSAINQTLSPKCICIVDDGSTDNSWDIIKAYAEENQKEENVAKSEIGDILIKVGNIRGIDIVGVKLPKPTGPSQARNIGIQLTISSTDVYAILDADDRMFPTKLERCVQPFTDPSVGVVYANYYNINSETGVSLLEVKEPYDIFRLNQECIVHSGSLIRVKYLEKVVDENGYYDVHMRTCEDWDLWLRLCRICNFYHVPEALTNVLVHPQNSSLSVSKAIWEQNWRRIKEKHYDK